MRQKCSTYPSASIADQMTLAKLRLLPRLRCKRKKLSLRNSSMPSKCSKLSKPSKTSLNWSRPFQISRLRLQRRMQGSKDQIALSATNRCTIPSIKRSIDLTLTKTHAIRTSKRPSKRRLIQVRADLVLTRRSAELSRQILLTHLPASQKISARDGTSKN